MLKTIIFISMLTIGAMIILLVNDLSQLSDNASKNANQITSVQEEKR